MGNWGSNGWRTSNITLLVGGAEPEFELGLWRQIPIFRLRSGLTLWKLKQDKVFYSLTTSSFPSVSICCHPFHHWETVLISSPSTPDPRLREKRERKEETTVLQRNLKKCPEWEKVIAPACQYEECWEKTSSANQSECIWKLKAVARVGDSRVTAVCGTSSNWGR